jgi:hypothetical protein
LTKKSKEKRQMSNGYIRQVELQPAVNDGDVGVFFEIASEVTNPFGGSTIITHRASLSGDEISEEVVAAAKVLFNACADAAGEKMPTVNGEKLALSVDDFDTTVADLKAKRQPE